MTKKEILEKLKEYGVDATLRARKATLETLLAEFEEDTKKKSCNYPSFWNVFCIFCKCKQYLIESLEEPRSGNMTRFIQNENRSKPKKDKEKPRELKKPGKYSSEDLMNIKKVNTSQGRI